MIRTSAPTTPWHEHHSTTAPHYHTNTTVPHHHCTTPSHEHELHNYTTPALALNHRGTKPPSALRHATTLPHCCRQRTSAKRHFQQSLEVDGGAYVPIPAPATTATIKSSHPCRNPHVFTKKPMDPYTHTTSIKHLRFVGGTGVVRGGTGVVRGGAGVLPSFWRS
jgi:hypothetical protein